MRNPWLDLPTAASYILKDDLPAIEAFNKKASDETKIRPDELPQPFLGNPNAPVVLLLLNPRSPEEPRKVEEPDSDLLEDTFTNLRHGTLDYPIFRLDRRKYASDTYWTEYFKDLIEKCELKAVARGVFIVEYFPYSSRSYGFYGSVPSQRYGWYLVRQAIEREAHIVQGRSRREWLTVVPELFSYQKYHQLNSTRSPYLTRNNCKAFDQLVEAIKTMG
ncbi:MAG: hypothetical protein JXJ17_06290 [Anaerolineae bacterium]|nr:hypothetical protein [Anaerolineae bacterium]